MTTRRQIIQGAAAGMLGLAPFHGFAQNRVETLRIIVGFPPGGTTDAFARRIAEKMRGTYANNVIVDNKPGAGGQIGVTTLKSAPADGAHILYSPASMLTIYPHSYSKLSYAPSDVAPIGIGHSTDHAFVVGPAVPDSVKNVKDFVEWAKANPGKASIGNPAAGSMPHLLAGRLAMLGNFQITNVPFPGSGPAIPQVMGGQLAGMSSPLGDWVQHHKAGKIRILATSGPDRAVYTPDVATYREQGFGELQVREWFGFFAPTGTPPDVIAKLNTAINKAMASADVVDRFAQLGMSSTPNSASEFGAFLKTEVPKWAAVVKSSGAKAD